MDNKSILSFCTSTGILPTACTPSTAKMIPCSLAILPISAIGLITPISLLAYMMVIKIVFGVNAPIALHRQISHLVSVLFQPLAGIEHSLVLNGLRNDVVALLAVHLRDALNHQIVGFRRPAGEDDLLWRGADQRSHLRARVLHRFLAGPAERVVAAGSVSEFFREIRQHRVHHTW